MKIKLEFQALVIFSIYCPYEVSNLSNRSQMEDLNEQSIILNLKKSIVSDQINFLEKSIIFKYRLTLKVILIIINLSNFFVQLVVTIQKPMPYETIEDLPAPVRKYLPIHAQHIYLQAFNHAWNEYIDPHKRRNPHDSLESICYAVAWAAVKHKYHKDKKTKMWVPNEPGYHKYEEYPEEHYKAEGPEFKERETDYTYGIDENEIDELDIPNYHPYYKIEYGRWEWKPQKFQII